MRRAMKIGGFLPRTSNGRGKYVYAVLACFIVQRPDHFILGKLPKCQDVTAVQAFATERFRIPELIYAETSSLIRTHRADVAIDKDSLGETVPSYDQLNSICPKFHSFHSGFETVGACMENG